MSKQGSIFQVFSNKNFSRLFLAMITKEAGSIIGLTAFLFYILDRFSEQPYYATITEMMYSLPTLLVFFLVGVLADRLDRQKIAYYCDWISAGCTLLLLLAIGTGWMPLIFALLFLRSAISKFFNPAQMALVQGILRQEEYATAAGLNQMVMSLLMLFGTGLGLLAYWNLGIAGALVVDMIAFILSGFLIASCKIKEEARLPNGKTKLSEIKLALILEDFRLGLSYIFNHRLLLSILSGVLVLGVINGGFSVLPIFTLKYKLAPETYEAMMFGLSVSIGVGIILGSIVASYLAQRFKLYHLIIGGLFAGGLLTMLTVLVTSIVVFYAVFFAMGICIALISVAFGGWLPRLTDPKMRGRVSGLMNPTQMLSQSITLGIIAITYPRLISLETIYMVVGASFLLVGLLYGILLPRLAARYDTQQEAPHQEGLGVRQEAGATS